MMGRRSRSKSNNKIATLKKFRKHCYSPGVRQLIRNSLAIRHRRFDDEKQLRQRLKEARSSRAECKRSPMLDAVNCKRSLCTLQKERLVHSSKAQEKDGVFRQLSGCVLSAPSNSCEEATVEANDDNVPDAVATSRKKKEKISDGESSGAHNLTPNSNLRSWQQVSCRVVKDKSQSEKLITSGSEVGDMRSLDLIAKDAEELCESLDPTFLLKINPRLRTISESISRLKSLLENQCNDAIISDTESEVGSIDESGNPCLDNTTYSPIYGHSNDDLIMSDIASAHSSIALVSCSHPANDKARETPSYGNYPWSMESRGLSRLGTHADCFNDPMFTSEPNSRTVGEEYYQEPFVNFKFDNRVEDISTGLNSTGFEAPDRSLSWSYGEARFEGSPARTMKHRSFSDVFLTQRNDGSTLSMGSFSLMSDDDTSPPNVFNLPGRII